MIDAVSDTGRLLETFPVPAFIALHDGGLVYANEALSAITGQPDLAGKERTLFGLGIFHNPAELRGFIRSFDHGGDPRKLMLPVGRLTSVSKPIILYASRISWQGTPAICGVLTKTVAAPADNQGGADWQDSATSLLDKLDASTLRVDHRGESVFVSDRLAAALQLDAKGTLPALSKLDLDHDPASLARYMRQAQSHGSMTYEANFQRADNTVFPARVHMAPLRTPGSNPAFILTVKDLTDIRKLERDFEVLEAENHTLTTEVKRKNVLVSERYDATGKYAIVSGSEAYRSVLRKINQVAPTNSTVLISGETGTGKELIARAIHGKSRRADRPMVIINCGALPSELIESELFGYRKGAFTGARADYLGRFELADQGTLFLDEIGEMPMVLQTRLLRVLQDGEFTPLGSKESVHTDVRIIAATNRDLWQRVSDGDFRSDLYFRLNVFPIYSIPLRERPQDIPLLVDHFIAKYSDIGQEPLPTISSQDLKRLMALPFSGNIRELENIIQRALILTTGPELQIELDVSTSSDGAPGREVRQPSNGTADDLAVLNFDEVQRRHIQRVLALTGGKVSGKAGAAKLLGMNPQTLFSKMRKLNVDRTLAPTPAPQS